MERAEKIHTLYGESVLLTSKESPQSCVKVFLPGRLGTLFKEADLTSINKKSVALAVRYRGTCPTSNSYILETE
jgi:hypothetical protein